MQVMLHLPDAVAQRFRAAVPARSRSAFVAELLEQALPDVDAQMEAAARRVQADDDQRGEAGADWDATLLDGLDPEESFDPVRLKALVQAGRAKPKASRGLVKK